MALKKYHERGGSANAAASGFVGIYSPEDRKQRIMRFLEKRKRRMWTKKVKYDVRKVSMLQTGMYWYSLRQRPGEAWVAYPLALC
jgi:hypothetical protein